MNTFRVMQFNMQYGQVWDDTLATQAPIDLDLTVAEILRQDADVILLQEVEHAQRGGQQVQPPPNYMRLQAALKEYHGYFSYPRADERELPFGIGLAIFCKTPMYDLSRLELPSAAVRFEFGGSVQTPTDRLLIGAKTRIQGCELQLFNTHLLAYFMLGSSSELYPQQRQLVVEQLRNARGPTLIAGDFNVSRRESLLQQFGDAGYRSVQTEEVTWRHRPFVLDHIFHNQFLRPLKHNVLPTRASDHHILVADFEFQT